MLVMPRAMWMTGMVAGMAMSAAAVAAGGWTLYVLLALFLEYKALPGHGGCSGKGAASASDAQARETSTGHSNGRRVR